MKRRDFVLMSLAVPASYFSAGMAFAASDRRVYRDTEMQGYRLRPVKIDWAAGEVPLIIPRDTQVSMYFSGLGGEVEIVLSPGHPVVAKRIGQREERVLSEKTDDPTITTENGVQTVDQETRRTVRRVVEYQIVRSMMCGNRSTGKVDVYGDRLEIERIKTVTRTIVKPGEVKIVEQRIPVVTEKPEKEIVTVVKEVPVYHYEMYVVRENAAHQVGNLPGPVVQTFPRLSSFNAGVVLVRSPGTNLINNGGANIANGGTGGLGGSATGGLGGTGIGGNIADSGNSLAFGGEGGIGLGGRVGDVTATGGTGAAAAAASSAAAAAAS